MTILYTFSVGNVQEVFEENKRSWKCLRREENRVRERERKIESQRDGEMDGTNNIMLQCAVFICNG